MSITSDPAQPEWTPVFIEEYALSDAIDLVQYGQTDELTFEKLRVDTSGPSSW